MKDAPEHDPNVKAVGGDVTALSIEELRRRGVSFDARPVVVEVGTGEAWRTHSEFLRDMDSWDVADRAFARRLAADHVARTGDLRGLKLPRSFPCLGTLRVLEKHGRMVIVSCDTCGFTFGVSAPRDPRDEDERPRRRRRPVDHSDTTPGGW